MRLILLTLLFAMVFGVSLIVRARRSATTPPPLPRTESSKPDFETQIRPIFQNRCQPCHFQGGKVYDKLPFDRPETIIKLGSKIFTRIKDEKEQRVIKEFLAGN